MMPRAQRSTLTVAAMLGLAALACGFPMPRAADDELMALGEATSTGEGHTASATLPVVTPTAPPTPSPTPTEAPTPTPAIVTVTANGANLTLRRGPALAYDTVGYLPNSQVTKAIGRNASVDWLLVERPGAPGQSGWIYLGRYASVEGVPETLPVVSVDPAKPAYLRNCTYHPMRIVPGDFTLPDRLNEPNNVRQVNPGRYEAYDMSAEGNPRVFVDDVREGQRVDIITDGMGNSYPCP